MANMINRCRPCGNPIFKGQRIVHYANGTARHYTCHATRSTLGKYADLIKGALSPRLRPVTVTCAVPSHRKSA